MKYYDSLETRDPEERERSLMERLPRQVAHAKLHSPYFARLLAEVNPNDIHNRAALACLPVTRKSDLVHLQREQAPFGGINATPLSGLSRVYASPGPIYDPEGRGQDWWRFARALHGAPLQPDLALGGRNEAGDRLEQRRLAASGCAQQHEAIGLVHVEAHLVCGAHFLNRRAVDQADAIDLEQRAVMRVVLDLAHGPSRFSCRFAGARR